VVDGPDEIPEQIEPRTVVFSGRPARWVAFDCPCGRGHLIMVPVTDSADWRMTKTSPPTLHPSINDLEHGCHFWLRDGRAHWT
jgi:hypothetical protein